MPRPKKQPQPQTETRDLKQEDTSPNDEMQKKIDQLELEKRSLEAKLNRKAPKDLSTRQHVADKATIEEMRQDDSRKVKGIFRCFNPPNGSVEFYFRKYKQDGVSKYNLKDGEEYELPVSVVKHLNENCFEDDHGYLLDANGDKIKGLGKRNHRFAFTPVNV